MQFLAGPKKVRNFLWGEPPVDSDERKLLFKIDWFVLSYVCSVYWVNYLDRANLSSAFVSGMKEELQMYSNELNIINTVFLVGYVVGMIPNNLMLLKVRPKYWLTFCCMCWGILTLVTYKVTNWRQICAIRFFMALFESSTFSGSHLILGSWYNAEDIVDEATGMVKSSELTKRSAVFTASGLLGSIFSNLMQASIHKNMDGLNGIAGWRWLFIIDFIVTVPICLYGFIFFPDTPDTCKAFYFRPEEIQLAKDRVKNPEMESKFDWSVFRRVIGRWHWWLFSFLWIMGGENESFSMGALFSVYLKYFKYSVDDINHYPMGMYAVGIISTFSCALYVDHTGGRYHWHIVMFVAASLLTVAIIILAAPYSTAAQFVAHYMSGISYAGQATFFAWANLVTRNDLQERAVVLASMNMWSAVVNSWWSLVFYPVTTAPEFKRGCYAMIGTTVTSALTGAIIRYLQLRDSKKAVLCESRVEDLKALDSVASPVKNADVVSVKSV
jgi:ACS family pantothenate transporter-like MFS transporter